MDTSTDGLAIYMGGVARTTPVAFDLDSTLICTKSGRIFAKDHTDWRWLFPQVPIVLRTLRDRAVIFTNQASSKDGKIATLELKLDAMFAELGFALPVYIATGYDRWRKPLPSMWEQFCADSLPALPVVPYSRHFGTVNGVIAHGITNPFMFVGDAGGLDGDHSDCDIKFAANAGLQYVRPEEYFLDARVDHAMFPPMIAPIIPLVHGFVPRVAHPSVVILVGYSASGKSHYANLYAASVRAAGGTASVINQDTIRDGRPGNVRYCLTAARTTAGTLIIDNTNMTRDTRKLYVDIARRTERRAVGVWINISFEDALAMNQRRAYLGGRNVPKFGMTMQRSKFVQPDAIEFDELITLAGYAALPTARACALIL